MKRAFNSQILGSPHKVHELDERCLDCDRQLLGFSDGSGLCIIHGWFEPEQGDENLYLLREHFDLMFNISKLDRLIAFVLSMPQVRTSHLTDGTLRDARTRGLSLRIAAEAIAHGLNASSLAQAIIVGIDCAALNRALTECSNNNEWKSIPSVNADMQAARLK